MISVENLKFDENGLIPAVVVDHYTKEVLTLAYMNRESLEITMQKGLTCFYSRSRKKLWLKGETSGNFQHVVRLTLETGTTWFWSRSRQELWHKGATSGNTQRLAELRYDCDADALVVEVVKDGPACHTGSESCFFNPVWHSDTLKDFSYDGLYELVKGRKTNPQEGSYTTYLFQKGIDKILKKVGEECTEVIIGAKNASQEEAVFEIADLTYHLMVLMAEMGITPSDITRELEKRHVVDKKVKQETMK